MYIIENALVFKAVTINHLPGDKLKERLNK